MAIPLAPKQLISFEKLLMSQVIQSEALTRSLHAQEKRAPLGNGNFAVKLDYIPFTDDHFDKPGNEDDGLYIGLEGYARIIQNLYLGGEVWGAVNIDISGEDISFFPVEVNLKYAIAAARNFVVDFGAGVS